MIRNIVKISIVAIFVIILICCIVSGGEEIIDYSNITYEQVELQTLFDDLDKNALAANKNYKNKYVEICGEISTIAASGDYISLRVPNAGFTLDSILCKIYNKELREFVMIHEEGDMITVQGQITDVGEVLGYVLRSHSFIGE